MTRRTNAAETLARELRKADVRVYWTKALPTVYREQARAILASDWLAAVKAEAWDEGYTIGNRHNGRRDANPYRAAQVAPSRVPSEES